MLVNVIGGTGSRHTLEISRNRFPGLGFDMVYCADDTILSHTQTGRLNELLGLVERVSMLRVS